MAESHLLLLNGVLTIRKQRFLSHEAWLILFGGGGVVTLESMC